MLAILIVILILTGIGIAVMLSLLLLLFILLLMMLLLLHVIIMVFLLMLRIPCWGLLLLLLLLFCLPYRWRRPSRVEIIAGRFVPEKNGLVHSYTTMGGPTVTTIVTTIVVFAAGSLSRDNRCGRGRGIRGVVIVRLPERVVRPIIVFDNVLVGDPILSQQELHQHGQHSGSIFSLDAMEHDCVIVVSSLVVMLLLLLLMIRMFFFIVLLLSSNRCCCCCWQSYRCFCRCRHFSLLTIERHCLQGQTQAILPRWCFQNGLVEARQSACVEFGHYGVVELGVDVYAGG
mmetsp:Transcript_1159/g.2238  ORF Transcript_1159/g.2238 Transcript_1159/m.2238 type:complete len:287 (-) Transcript_1159:505-1365(-)